MNDKKLECLVEGYEGTYYEVGQVWETRNGEKIVLKDFIKDADYPLLFDIGNTIYEEFTLRGTFYEGDEHDLDLVKLISTESTPSKPQSKTLSEYLKENDAYEIFIETCVAHFLKYTSAYEIFKKDNIPMSLSNTFTWYGSNRDGDLWSELDNNLPKDIIYDMNENVFVEVDKRLSKEKVEPNFMTTEKFDRVIQEFMTKKEFNQMLGRKSPKRYMLFVEGKSSPKKIHTDLDTAEEEAKRLATREIGSKVFLVEIVKEYKSRLEIDEL